MRTDDGLHEINEELRHQHHVQIAHEMAVTERDSESIALADVADPIYEIMCSCNWREFATARKFLADIIDAHFEKTGVYTRVATT